MNTFELGRDFIDVMEDIWIYSRIFVLGFFISIMGLGVLLGLVVDISLFGELSTLSFITWWVIGIFILFVGLIMAIIGGSEL